MEILRIMSDLSISLAALERSRTQLSAASYFDEDVFSDERALIFDPGPRYAGHELWVPEAGDYHALPQEGEGRALVRDAQGVRLVSNVCRHRQALMLRGRGQTREHIVCPLHRWTYDLRRPAGRRAALRRRPLPEPEQLPDAPLARPALRRPRARRARGLRECSATAALDFSGHVLDRVEMHECDYNWKTFIEVYLEDYHVGPFHPGLGDFVTCDDLRWEFGEHHSVQTVGLQQRAGAAGSATYRRWHEALLAYSGGDCRRTARSG